MFVAVFVARFFGGMRAQRFAEIDQVVLEKAPAVFLDVGGERVVLFDVGVVHPSREDAKTPELAPMLVGNGVVRVIAARALRRQASFGNALDEFAGGCPVASVVGARCAVQGEMEVLVRVRLL